MNYKFFLASVLAFLPVISWQKELQKVFHVKMAKPLDAPSTIEWGKIILYFSHEPVIKKSEQSSTDKKEYQQISFFIPGIDTISDEAKQMIASLKAADQKYYKADLKLAHKPIPGIELVIVYDPSMILIKYDTFDAITKAKAFEVRLYNKTLLQALARKKESILRTSSNAKSTVIIDCGHGGPDKGTIGFFKTVEKNITLAVGKQLAQELAKNGVSVILTRTDDCFIGLDERASLANACKNNAFLISLHANNAPKKEVNGLETFYLDTQACIARDTSLRTAIDVITDECDREHTNYSKKLAHAVHTGILQAAQHARYDINDRKVKSAASIILRGTKWPSILIEMDFLSNKKTAALLNNPEYQKVLVQGMCNGIKNYLLGT